MYRLSDYNYTLPESLIAHYPAERRDTSRLLVLNRKNGDVLHRRFSDLPDFLMSSDLLLVNDTRVIPARLFGRKSSGGRVEVLVLNYGEGRHSVDTGGAVVCECLIRASKRPRPGTRLFFDGGTEAEVVKTAEMVQTVRFICPKDFGHWLLENGRMPLPPYIDRDVNDATIEADREAYQTVYAARSGAIAAPTAGLHFTDSLMARIRAAGVTVVTITLHVGYGTFLPVRSEDIRAHQMHSEWYSISSEAAAEINKAKAEGRRVVAVGTTSVRTVEYVGRRDGRLRAGRGECDLFIYPGFRFKIVDALITNFHLPESTLLMLVSAFAGREAILDAYHEAIEQEYRFFSYGDAMLIL